MNQNSTMDTQKLKARMDELEAQRASRSEELEKLQKLKEEAYAVYEKETKELRAKLEERELLYYAPVKDAEKKMEALKEKMSASSQELETLKTNIPILEAQEKNKTDLLSEQGINSYGRLLGFWERGHGKPANYGKPVGKDKNIYLYKYDDDYHPVVWLALFEGKFISYCSRPKSKYLGDNTYGSCYLGYKAGKQRENIQKGGASMSAYYFEGDDCKPVEFHWTLEEARKSPLFEGKSWTSVDGREYTTENIKQDGTNYVHWLGLLNTMTTAQLKKIKHIDLTDAEVAKTIRATIGTGRYD